MLVILIKKNYFFDIGEIISHTCCINIPHSKNDMDSICNERPRVIHIRCDNLLRNRPKINKHTLNINKR